MKRLDCSLIFLIALLFVCSRARADPIIELSGATGAGVLVAGVTSGRFALSPSASFSVRGEHWFFLARDTLSFLGAAGGRFGITNETTLGVAVDCAGTWITGSAVPVVRIYRRKALEHRDE